MTPEERMKLLLTAKEEKIPPMSPEEWAMIRPSQHPDATEFSDQRNEIMPNRRPWGREIYEASQDMPPRQQIESLRGGPPSMMAMAGGSRTPPTLVGNGSHRMPDGVVMPDGHMRLKDLNNPQPFRTGGRGEISVPSSTTIELPKDLDGPISFNGGLITPNALNTDGSVSPDGFDRNSPPFTVSADGETIEVPDYLRGKGPRMPFNPNDVEIVVKDSNIKRPAPSNDDFMIKIPMADHLMRLLAE